MIDIKLIENDPEAFVETLKKRGYDKGDRGFATWMVERLLESRQLQREAITEMQAKQAEQKTLSARVHEAMKANETITADALRVASLRLSESIEYLSRRAEGNTVREDLLQFPNIAADDVPDGLTEADNVVLHVEGTPPEIENPKDHVDLGVGMGCLDFENTVKMSGPRLSTLSGPLARLERALGQFMLDQHTSLGWREVSPPTLVQGQALFGTGQFPKFERDVFTLQDEDMHLIPTAEVSLTNLVREQVLRPDQFPIRMVALTDCFRSEAGSAGRDTRGLIRQHQFKKVELVTIAHPDDSERDHEFMREAAEGILKALGLAYRRVLLCKGDMGFAARKTYDLEVWLPGQQTYREISSISNCGDFQARRLETRFKRVGEKKTEFVHTLNGSGLAVGRTLVAVMENYQRPDGGITIPEILRPYMHGAVGIDPRGNLTDS